MTLNDIFFFGCRRFVLTYYPVMSKSAEDLIKFYKEDSCFSHVPETEGRRDSGGQGQEGEGAGVRRPGLVQTRCQSVVDFFSKSYFPGTHCFPSRQRYRLLKRPDTRHLPHPQRARTVKLPLGLRRSGRVSKP